MSLFIFIDKDSRGVRTIGVKRFGYICGKKLSVKKSRFMVCKKTGET